MAKTPSDVLKLAKDAGAKIVDVRFIDMPGVWQHFSFPVQELSECQFTEGMGFDGSSIRGYQQIQESDMLLFADPETAVMDPMLEIPTSDPDLQRQGPDHRRGLHPRPALHRPEGRELPPVDRPGRHQLLGPGGRVLRLRRRPVRPAVAMRLLLHRLGRGRLEHRPRRGRQNLGYKLRHKEGYFPVPPADSLQDIRSEMILKLMEVGMQIELHHHEVATAGQCEIDIRFGPLVRMADNLLWYKYIIKNVARKHGKTVTFMPKPMYGDNGSGMHCHQSLWKGGKPLFYDEKGYAGLSATWPAGTSAACSSTPRRSSPSPTRRPTRTAGWCPATRRR